LQQHGETRRMFAHEGLSAFRRSRHVPAERVEFVIADDAMGLARIDHVPYQMQRLADPRATVDDVAQENHLTLGMTPDATLLAVTHGIEQVRQCVRTAMHIAYQVI